MTPPDFMTWLTQEGFRYNDDPESGGGWLAEDSYRTLGTETMDDLQQQWSQQYGGPYNDWLRFLGDNPDASQYIGGTAGLVAPGYYPSLYGGSTGQLYDEFGLTPAGGTSPLGADFLTKQQEFATAHPGYGQITPDQITIGPNGEVQFKTAGPSAGQYVADPSKVILDPTYGYISPLDNLGQAGMPSESFLEGAWPVLMAAGGFLGPALASTGSLPSFGGVDLNRLVLDPFSRSLSTAGSTLGEAAGMGGADGVGLAEGAAGGAGGGSGMYTTGYTGGALDMGQLSVTDMINLGMTPQAAIQAAAQGAAGLGAGSGLSTAAGGLFSGITSENVFRALVGAGMNAYQASQYAKAAEKAAGLSDSLSQPKRFPYQDMLAQLLQNPTQFYETNPVVKAQMDLARRQFEANTGKMGTGGTQFGDYLQHVQRNAAGTFNDQANLLSQLGGFTFGPTNAGTNYGNLIGQSINQTGEIFRGIGQDIFGHLGRNIFGQGGAGAGNNNIFSLA